MVNILNPCVHEYDFPYHDTLKQYKNEILNQYFIEKKTHPNLTDLNLPINHPLISLLIPSLNKIVNDNFIVEKPLMNFGLRVYVQNQNLSTSFYHMHKTASSLSGVFYLDPPKEGGEITFLIEPDANILSKSSQKELIIKPKKDKLYFFPYWLFHKPLPQKDEEYRICFNWLYGSPIRPIHKLSLTSW